MIERFRMGQTEEDKLLNEVTGKSYEFGFTTDIESDTIAPGLNEDVIREISAKKKRTRMDVGVETPGI